MNKMLVASWWESVLKGCRTDNVISSIFWKEMRARDNGYEARKSGKRAKNR